jgi:AICAR transformylase/IMP cyclohydrolase PurH
MKRIAISNCPAWFDQDTAKEFPEKTRFDGNNHISLSTGSQWEHQALYLTKSNNWVLHSYSQRQGSLESWEKIEELEAANWMVKNEYDSEDIPKSLIHLVSSLEI